LAKTELEEKSTLALPEFLVLKLMVRRFPEEPVKPGFKTIPPKFMVPREFENSGS